MPVVGVNSKRRAAQSVMAATSPAVRETSNVRPGSWERLVHPVLDHGSATWTFAKSHRHLFRRATTHDLDPETHVAAYAGRRADDFAEPHLERRGAADHLDVVGVVQSDLIDIEVVGGERITGPGAGADRTVRPSDFDLGLSILRKAEEKRSGKKKGPNPRQAEHARTTSLPFH